MKLAEKMNRNIRNSRAVAEAMLRNLLTTLELLEQAIASSNKEERLLLSACAELQVKYAISHKMVLIQENKNEAQKINSMNESQIISLLLDEYGNIIKNCRINTTPTVIETMRKLFYSQQNAVNHISNFIENLEKQVLNSLCTDLVCPVKFQVRFKSYLSFLIKMLKKYYARDYMQLTSFYDFIAFKLILMSELNLENSYIDYCYEVFNQTITTMSECGYKLIPLKSCGKSDKRINPLYADFIKDYVSNPKCVYIATKGDKKFVCDSIEKCKAIEAKVTGLKWKKQKIYRALHFACCKDANYGECQVLLDFFVKNMRNHTEFKKNTRGEIESIFDPSQYNLLGFKYGASGAEIIDFYYFKQPKIFCDQIVRP